MMNLHDMLITVVRERIPSYLRGSVVVFVTSEDILKYIIIVCCCTPIGDILMYIIIVCCCTPIGDVFPSFQDVIIVHGP